MKRWVKEILLAAAGTAAIVGTAYALARPDPPLMEYRYTAQAGDTVWGICSRIASNEDNLQQVVWQAMKDSHIEKGDRLQPGQVVIVKVKEIGK